MEYEQTFAARLKQQRKALDLTQADLARLVGCAVITLQKIEAGRRRPSKQMAELLAQHLAIAPDTRDSFLRGARAEPTVVRSTRPQQAGPVSPLHVPVPLTPLIGRATEVAALWRYLTRPEIRLMTLLGPPGVGKTRLSIQVASALAEQFPAGVWFIALAAVREPDLVVPAIARALGLKEAGTQPLAERLQTALGNKRVLLVLDNLEQVVAAAPQITALLAACGQIKVLITSRVPLHAYGEHEYLVEPFAIPDWHADATPERLIEFDAVRLFIARVQAFKPQFALTVDTGPAIAEVCARLSGLPLAIELAAARIRQFTPSALVAQARGAGLFPLLSAGPRDLPARQQTLHNAITWSYNLLEPAQQRLFRQLGVFVGGWTHAAAMAVCSSASVDALNALADHQLIRQELAAQHGARGAMLEMMRVYALAELTAQYEGQALGQAHATYFLQLAEAVDEESEPAWLIQLEQEHDNLRAALRWALAYDAHATGLRLCAALQSFWEAHGHWSEGRQRTELMLAAAADAAPRQRMQALHCIAEFAWKQGDYVQAGRSFTEALTLAEAVQDKGAMAHASMLLGKIALDQGNHAAAAEFLHNSVALCQALGDAALAPRMHLGELALMIGAYAQARQILEEVLALYAATGELFMTAATLRWLGEALLAAGDHQGARALLREGVARSRATGHQRVLVFTLTVFAEALVRGPQPYAAAVCAAAQIWGAVEVVREDVGMFVPSANQARFDQAIAYARAQISAEAWAVAWEQGRALSLEQASALALGLPVASV